MNARNPHHGDDPHGDQPVATAGPALADAAAAIVAVHGRGATAQSMLEVTDAIAGDDVVVRAPQAAARTWYPNPFTAPTDSNQPGLDSALARVDALVAECADALARAHVVVLGFSQGACLASEYVARNPTRFGGLVCFSGGLIGPTVTTDQYDGDLAGTPVFLGCDGNDPHIERERVHETTHVLTDLGGDVDERIYDGIGHGVVPDEIDAASDVVDAARREP